jgi:Zn-dependent protease
MADPFPLVDVVPCGGCGRSVPPRLTVCPSCHGLIHRAELEALSAQATAAESAGDWPQAARLWRDALPLLPSGTKQHDAIVARVNAATSHIGQTPAVKRTGWGRLLAPFAVVGAAAWKLKFLLSGLLKIGTLLSMLAFLGVYWAEYGWRFALAFVITIYIHEMGHVAALRRLGFAATAPMFIPGFGALVRLQQHPATTAEDARIGLAGPIWGVAAAVAAFAIGWAMPSKFFYAVAFATAWINLFNLIPVWQLDGGRGFNGMSRLQRWLVVAIAGAAWALTRDGMFVLVALPGVWRALQRDAPREDNWEAFAQFAGLLAVIAAVLYTAAR